MKNITILSTLLLLTCISYLQAQYFTYHSNAPFGIQLVKPDMTRAAQQIMFYDYDGDGDLDAFLSGLDFIDDFENWEGFHFFIEMQVNVGTKYAPQFSDRVAIVDPFPYPVGYFLSTIGDLNADGKPDFIIGVNTDPYIGTQKQQMLLQNAPPMPAGFTVSNLDQFGLTDFVPESAFKPELIDLDGDGDLDLMNSGFNSAFGEEDGPDVPIFYYARNAGTSSSPYFEGWYVNPYAMMPDPLGEIITSGDIDNDGDIDFVGGVLQTPIDSNFYLTVHINTPDVNGRPGFSAALHSPYGMPVSFGETQLTFPELTDLDGDGDQDLFVFRGDASNFALEYYENDLCQLSEVLLDTTICSGESITIGDQTFDEAGQYMIQLSGSNGCDMLIMLHLEVDVDVLDASVAHNDHILTANADGVNYQWIDCDTGQPIASATQQSYEVMVTGNYAVILTSDNGCVAQSACTEVIITSVSNNNVEHSLLLYPNPTNGMIHFSGVSGKNVGHVTVMNITGKKIISSSIDVSTGLDMSGFVAGLYFVVVEFEGSILTGKVMVGR